MEPARATGITVGGRAGEQLVLLEGIHKWFGNLHVIKGVDLALQQRDVVVVIGPSGGGKSTLLRCVSLLEEPTLGRVWFEDRDITDIRADLNEVRTHIGMVFQAYNLFPHMTAERNVRLVLEKVLKLPSDEAHDRAMADVGEIDVSSAEPEVVVQRSGYRPASSG